jgi:Tfp pilus assembly protein PilX
MKTNKGQILVGVLVLLVVLAILVPTMVKYVQNEARWSEKQRQNTNAFQLAEGAVDRGYKKIAESTSTWTELMNGQVQPGFNFDTVYDDLEGGTYTISLTSGPQSGEVTILTVGRDRQNKETRALKVVYSKGGVDSAMYANGISINGGVDVQWGPMKSRGNLVLTGAADLPYPRKYAVGSITGWATTSPCTDNIENWAYNCSPGVPPPPQIATNDYRLEAQRTKCPASWAAGASPAGSCYWPNTVAFNGPVMTSTATLFFEQNLTIQNSFLWGNVIVMGNLDFKGGGKGAYLIPTAGAPAPFTGGIPPTAWKEYMSLDTAAQNEYFGDAGYQTLNPTFEFKSGGSTPDKKDGVKNVNPSVRGLVYIAGVLSASGGSVVHGMIMCPNGISGLSGSISVFYDVNVAEAMLTDTIYPTRISWLSSKQAWPAALP